MFEHEQKIIDILQRDRIVFDPSDQEDYALVLVGKPEVPGGGECKTDVYALYENVNEPSIKMELKISAKKSNAQFLENKLNAAKAENIFGVGWSDRLVSGMSKAFSSQPSLLVYDNIGYGNVEKDSFCLGYRLDLMNSEGGILSFPLITTYKEKLLVLSGGDEYGSILSPEKTNPIVGGVVVQNGGVANFMFCNNDDPKSAQEIFNGLVPIEDYAYGMGDIYGALKADNFRFRSNKFENRWLAAYISWFADEGMLVGALCYDAPLMYRAKDSKDALDIAFAELGIVSEEDLLAGENISEYAIYL